MASLINLNRMRQQPYRDIEDIEDIIHSKPETHSVDVMFPVIAKGNIIEGVEAEE